MEDALWRLTQQSRTLQDFRKDISGVWSDTVARELNSRYLNPHEEDDQEIIKAFREQNEALEQAKEKLRIASEQAKEAAELSAKVVESLEFTQQELNSAYKSYDLYIQYHAEARSHLPLVQQFINKANDACPK